MEIRADPSPSFSPDPSLPVPFHLSRNNRIYLVTLWLRVGNNQIQSLVLFVPTKTLLDVVQSAERAGHGRDGAYYVPWDAWGPDGTRMMVPNHPRSRVWVCFVYGTRYIGLERPQQGDTKAWCRVYDFSDLPVRRGKVDVKEENIIRAPASLSDKKSPEAVYHIGASVIKAGKIFKVKVTTTYPFRYKSVELDVPLTTGHERTCAVMCSEDGIVIVDVCSQFRDIIDRDPNLQYQLDLASAGLEDGPPTGGSLTQRHEALKQYTSAWNQLKWSKEIEVPMMRSGLWELYGGVLGQNTHEGGFTFTRLPSVLRGIEEKTWTVDSPGFEYRDFTMDHGQDLLVLIEKPRCLPVPFHLSRNNRIYLVTLWLRVGISQIQSLVLFVPTKTLLDVVQSAERAGHGSDGTYNVPWDAWGPDGTRMMVSNHPRSRVWVCFVYGTRYIGLERPQQGDTKAWCRVYDFSDLPVRRGKVDVKEENIIRAPASLSDKKSPEAVYHIGASVIKAGKIFKVKVTTTYPFRYKSVELDVPLTTGHERTCAVMCSEDSIVVLDKSAKGKYIVLSF
ncbi:hypothetical protein H1R20_g4351, partial [Candolleomyces eurysporus]